mmetsp:Transcript_53454/g.153370  ORF Transcript_53454/g.153370 Transcript_53454/m.153370 type:complete len:328 (+) Transcript_53454:12-995(+)
MEHRARQRPARSIVEAVGVLAVRPLGILGRLRIIGRGLGVSGRGGVNRSVVLMHLRGGRCWLRRPCSPRRRRPRGCSRRRRGHMGCGCRVLHHLLHWIFGTLVVLLSALLHVIGCHCIACPGAVLGSNSRGLASGFGCIFRGLVNIRCRGQGCGLLGRSSIGLVGLSGIGLLGHSGVGLFRRLSLLVHPKRLPSLALQQSLVAVRLAEVLRPGHQGRRRSGRRHRQGGSGRHRGSRRCEDGGRRSLDGSLLFRIDGGLLAVLVPALAWGGLRRLGLVGEHLLAQDGDLFGQVGHDLPHVGDLLRHRHNLAVHGDILGNVLQTQALVA